jgi:hypothetical protein
MQTSLDTFGNPARYYTAKDSVDRSNQKSLFPSLESKVARLLQSYNPGLENQVQRSFKRWNPFIRDRLRIEMGLRLSTNERPRSVPVKIQDGLPLPFEKVVRELSPDVLRMLFNRPNFEATKSGLEVLLDHYDFIKDWKRIKESPAEQLEIEHVHKLLNVLIEQLRKDELINDIKKIREDILGAYFFYVPEIHLYWMVIGLIARMIDVSVESLTIVIAAHELAHAYSHLGNDIDNENWEVHDFAEAELNIVEGLAQHYTEIICNKLEDRMPEAKVAYKRLLKFQSEPYNIHLKWSQDKKANNNKSIPLGEVVRVSMIKCRSRGISHYEKFEEILEQQKTSLKIW